MSGFSPLELKPAHARGEHACPGRGGSTCAASASTVWRESRPPEAGRELRRPASRCARRGARTRGSAWSPPRGSRETGAMRAVVEEERHALAAPPARARCCSASAFSNCSLHAGRRPAESSRRRNLSSGYWREQLAARVALGGEGALAGEARLQVVGRRRRRTGCCRRPMTPAVQPLREVEVGALVAAELAQRDRGEHEVLVAQHVGEGDLAAAEEVAAGGDAHVERRPALQEQLLERALLAACSPAPPGGRRRAGSRRCSSAATWTSCSTSFSGSAVSIDCRRYSPLK